MAEDRDIVELLLEEHREFRELFEELEAAARDEREELFRYTVARLASHEAAEEAVVHRTVRDDVPSGQAVAEAVLAEEDSAEHLLAEMADMDPTSDEFMESLGRLRDDVVEHAGHEERDEFPLIREHVDAERRREMGRRFQQLRDSGPTRPHPGTPQQPETRAAAGPIVGAFDRARDAARNVFAD
ncbi:hemerythrin domain-containing protein [Egibacter rhizosphaerae]|uniref:Hemerythrin domain-containing protein n=1 Tax=Egibacter rhizosphaerae TaxID=1670831 RepID=A0A411YD87_9ACTN|nr:hemerythrin domain-containing protein [Egibacter rhizosphaerae]QBI19165.1 hemerythrin domain-containing protein [Egibacter rhizosphaerae]